MPRKRSRSIKTKPKHKQEVKQKTVIKRKNNIKFLVPIVLIGVFLLVLFFNSYFNYSSGMAFNPEGTTVGTRFYLSGPDPYYNMRTCLETLDKGQYAYLSPTDGDPFLNYPVGYKGGARPPLFNMIAIGSTHIVENFMPRMDALGWSMLFLPAIYGALLVFPIYGIGKELFNRKAGLISAFFIPLIPAHISGGHGSAFALFDHDSFVLLLFTISFLFMVKFLKQENKNKKLLYATLVGVTIGAIQLSWAAGHTVLFIILAYVIIQLFIDVLKAKYDIYNYLGFCLLYATSFLISLPYFIVKGQFFTFPFFIFMASIGILLLVAFLRKIKAPAIAILPVIGIVSGITLYFLYLVHIGYIKGIPVLLKLTEIIYGSGIYGNKVAYTIAEAHSFGLSQIVMNIGPILYWIGLLGLVLFMYKTYKTKFKSYNLFFVVTVLIQMWLLTAAGRFLNDFIPSVVILSGFVLSIVIQKLDYKKIFETIKKVGGFKGFYKGFNLSRVAGIIFIGVLLIPSNAHLALDGAVPPQLDKEIFGEEYKGYFGGSLSEQKHWADACYWLSQQDTDLKPEDRPAILTWWDYGFYLASMGEHPVVADNYQDGIFPAANFHTAQSEKEATAVLIVRLIEGAKEGTTKIDAVKEISNPEVKEVIYQYLGNRSEELINILEDPITYAPSYDTYVGEEWNGSMFKVREHNAMYQDASDILTNLSDDNLTELYLDIVEATGYNIRYYGIESRDIHSIFGVFPFLADKSSHGYDVFEDEWTRTYWVENNGNEYSYEDLMEMSSFERSELRLDMKTENKQPFFNSMIYRTFYGQSQENRRPTVFFKHWKPVFVGPYILIVKYYAGAKINGTVNLEKAKYDGSIVYVVDEYGIEHDLCVVDEGKFNVVVPAGNNSLVLAIKGNMLDVIKLENITEEEAMREVPYEKSYSFNINYSEPIFNVTGLNTTANLSISSLTYQAITKTKEITNGSFPFGRTFPDVYDIKIEKGNRIYYQKSIFLEPNKKIYNISIEG